MQINFLQCTSQLHKRKKTLNNITCPLLHKKKLPKCFISNLSVIFADKAPLIASMFDKIRFTQIY